MPVPTSPVVAAWELALRLRQRREHRGVEVKTITQALGFTRNYWSAVENERKLLSEENLVKLLDLLEFDEDERQELLALRAAAKQRGWWTRYSGLFNDEVQRMFGLESGARSVRVYESLLIPGLLQTADYARAIMEPAVTIRPVEVGQRIEARLHRQQRLRDEDPLRLTVIMSEAAIRQEIGGPSVLRSQLQHLAATVEEFPNVDVRILPFSATACGLFGAATVNLIDFESSRLPTVIWHETVTAAGIIDDPTQIRDIIQTYEDALKVALTAEQSLRLIRNRTKELNR